jgi:RimJ/RimL family protein N-acetyltransferase
MIAQPDDYPSRVVTERLTLRRPQSGDEAGCRERLVAAYATRHKPLRAAIADAFGIFMIEHWERYGFGFWIVELRASAVAIGNCGVKYVGAAPAVPWPREPSQIEVGYSLVPDFRRCGYAAEAVRATLKAAFAHLNVDSIRGRCDPANEPSASVMIRSGMREVSRDADRHFAVTWEDFRPMA